jgi:uncharacterized protein
MVSPLHSVRRHPERARLHRRDLDAVLDAGLHVATLSTVVDGQPWVVPMLYARCGDRVLLHGSTGAGALRHVASGAQAALCVTHLDAWVYAHTLFDSSANYRSAVVRGTLSQLTGERAIEALTELGECIFPGRSHEVPSHTRKQVAATQVLAIDIVDGQWTVKTREGGPAEPSAEDDLGDEVWTGTVPIQVTFGRPQTADHRPADLPVSPSVLSYVHALETTTTEER